RTYKISGPSAPIRGALILDAMFNPIKKKETFTVTPQIPPSITCVKCLLFIRCIDFRINGKKSSPAKKKRIKARVKGGISVRAYLKIGEAAPHMRFAKITAKYAVIYSV